MTQFVFPGEDIADVVLRLNRCGEHEVVAVGRVGTVTVREFLAFVTLARAFGLIPAQTASRSSEADERREP